MRTMNRRVLVAVVAIGLMAAAHGVRAQSYPVKPASMTPSWT